MCISPGTNGAVLFRVIVVLMLKNMKDIKRDLESEFGNVNVHYMEEREEDKWQGQYLCCCSTQPDLL